MRKLIALLAVTGFATQAFADNHMSQSGSFRVQYYNKIEKDFDGSAASSTKPAHNHQFYQRLLWSPSFRVSENLMVQSTLVHAAHWGENGRQASSTPGSAATGNASNNENVLVVSEAYANWSINDESSLRLGRGGLTVADGLVISSNPYEQVGVSLDGAMYNYDHEMARIGVLGLRLANDDSVDGADNDDNHNVSLWGLNVDFKSLPEVLKMVNLHYLIIKGDSGASSATKNENTTRMGVTLAGDTAGLDYKVTYAQYAGDTKSGAAETDVDTEMYDITLGFSMPDMMNFRVSATQHSDSGDKDTTTGDDEQYAGFFYDRHHNAGLMDVVGFGNLTYTRVGFTLDPMEDLSVGADYYMFTSTEKGANTDNYAPGTTTSILGSGDKAKDDLGDEIDLWVKKKYSSNFHIKGRYGSFAPGKRIKTGSSDDYNMYYLEGVMTF